MKRRHINVHLIKKQGLAEGAEALEHRLTSIVRIVLGLKNQTEKVYFVSGEVEIRDVWGL